MLDRVHHNCKRFEQCGLIQRNVTDRVHPPFLHHDVFAQASAAPGDSDEPHLLAQVVVAFEAGRTGAVNHQWFMAFPLVCGHLVREDVQHGKAAEGVFA